MLIIHGTRDPLVPVAATLEHHRLVPQSELTLIDGNHFMVFQRPSVIIMTLYAAGCFLRLISQAAQRQLNGSSRS
jgi:pimeloyl-ACP methyl ester carboxylesterase